ncbi:glycosyltransferase involved in cell wall biosynthesis [Aneurinibacillus soli]|uniref:D-inositol 3-phosphate glycosyltransferase n=2 Tax=Aneurinibacillus soli TaxID=1500254 RepID=A0A0U5BB23_9BACL|nr:glycosyltransferase family 4 protein [Aneurinibacillus soli]PYE64143.1 glycosyltransferase involved in cell wall biosynthesis [Aneurinibacillus soli]BAU28092.1 D-inositol 3-phosphate glycosyltransferase [Aneurinibacillus soli]
MKILIGTALALGTGGVRSYVQTLENELVAKGHDVSVKQPDLLRFYHKIMARIKSLGNHNKVRQELMKANTSSSFTKTRKYMQTNGENLELIHAQDVLYAASLREMHIPVVLTVHGPLLKEMEMASKLSQHVRSYIIEQERIAYEGAAHILAVDTGQKKIIVEEYNIDPEKITVLLNAVDTRLFTPLSLEEPEVPFYLVPRRLVPKNGVGVAIKAFRHLQDERMELWIVGDGPDRSILEELVDHEGLTNKVRFIGSIEQAEMVTMMNQAEGIVIPSIPVNGVIEASSISALEGMSVGKPVIASNIGGLSEMITHMKNGCLFSAGDDSELAALIRKLHADRELRKLLGENALEYVRVNHSSTAWSEKIVKVYESVCK